MERPQVSDGADYVRIYSTALNILSSHEQPIRDGPSGLGMGEGPKNASPLEDEQIKKRDMQPETNGN